MIAYQLSLLKIPVTDLAASAAFYKEHLKLNEEFIAVEYGWAQLSAGDLPIALYTPGQGGGDGKIGGSLDFHLALPAKTFDALAADLIPRKVVVDHQIHTGDDGSTFIQVRDPDGNILNLTRLTT